MDMFNHLRGIAFFSGLDTLMRSNETLMRRKKKQRLIVDVDSTEDPAHGKQENVAFNGHSGKNCFHPLFAFTSDGAAWERS
jgi:hypothetical protein